MQRMKAAKAFRLSENGLFINPGDEFDTRDPGHYEANEMAYPIREYIKPADKPRIENEASVAGPFVSDGGKTGETISLSSSDQDQAPAQSISRKYERKTSRS